MVFIVVLNLEEAAFHQKCEIDYTAKFNMLIVFGQCFTCVKYTIVLSC